MAQEEQKFLGKLGLPQLITEIKSGFANIVHQHTKADITDLEIDNSLSITSENPVQNQVITSALDEKVPMNRTVNGKSLEADINLTASDVGTLLEEEIQEKIDNIDVGIELTQAEYDALGDIVNTDGKTYFITDSEENFTANDILFNESIASGLTANTVQGAIESTVALTSDKFSEEKDYAIGDYCIYSNALYKFTGVKTAGAWDSTVAELTNIGTDVSAINANLIDTIYPIGSIYMSVNNVSPSTLFGGTWEQIKDRFLLSAGDTYNEGSTGGEASHTLTVNEMPSHSHSPLGTPNTNTYNSYQFQVIRDLGSSSTGRIQVTKGTGVYVNAADPNASDYGSLEDVSTKSTTASTGSSQAHNNMPPYLTVFVWKRVS